MDPKEQSAERPAVKTLHLRGIEPGSTVLLVRAEQLDDKGTAHEPFLLRKVVHGPDIDVELHPPFGWLFLRIRAVGLLTYEHRFFALQPSGDDLNELVGKTIRVRQDGDR